MVVVKIMGGTGNQMFQYAFGKRLATQFQCPLKFDLSFLESSDHDELYVRRNYSLDVFGIDGSFYDYRNGEGIDLKLLQERKFNFDEEIIPKEANVLIDGYWQTPKYFEPIEKEIRSDFDLSQLDGVVPEMCEAFSSDDAVCINVRRGDFVNNERSRAFHGVLGMDYIRTGVERIASQLDSPKFYVFSDDIEWCRHNILLDYPVHVIGHEHAGDRFSRYLFYMTRFRHYLIPNSSFAWWAVWLSQFHQQERMVVVPKKWFLDSNYCFDDLIPDSWIRI